MRSIGRVARRPRPFVEGIPLHLVQRGNNGQRCFFSDRDRLRYLALLRRAMGRYGVRLHAYVLMSNHVHLLASAAAADGVALTMQSVSAGFVRRINRNQARTGTLWDGRYFSCLVAGDRHLLAACRYIDLNPVRAGLVGHPGDYRWSSYKALAGLAFAPWLTPHPALELLGYPLYARYAAFCREAVDEDELRRLRMATRRQLAFGSQAFIHHAEGRLGRSLSPRAPGRPRRPKDG